MSGTKPILIVPSGVLSADEKKKVEESGYVLLVTDEPDKIKLITPVENTNDRAIMMSALHGLNGSLVGGVAKDNFINNLYNRLKAQEK